MGGNSFYIEATIAGEMTKEDKALHEIWHYINKKIQSEQYNLQLITFNPKTNSELIESPNVIIKTILNWIATLNLDSVKQAEKLDIDNVKDELKLKLNYKGLGLAISAKEKDAYHNTIVSISSYMANPDYTSKLIENKIRDKHRQLRDLDCPCVLAINTIYDFAADDHNLNTALIGNMAVSFFQNPNIEPETYRKKNGVFGEHEAKHKYLAGVLLTPGLQLHNIDRAHMTFMLNPWATKQLKDNNPLMQLKRMSVNASTGVTTDHDGLDAASIIKKQIPKN